MRGQVTSIVWLVLVMRERKGKWMEMNIFMPFGIELERWRRAYQVERAEFSRESIREPAGISSKEV